MRGLVPLKLTNRHKFLAPEAENKDFRRSKPHVSESILLYVSESCVLVNDIRELKLLTYITDLFIFLFDKVILRLIFLKEKM